MVTYFETYLISAYLNMNNFSCIFNWTNSNPNKSKTKEKVIIAPEEFERSPNTFLFFGKIYTYNSSINFCFYLSQIPLAII